MINFIKQLKRKIFGAKLTPYKREQTKGRALRSTSDISRDDFIEQYEQKFSNDKGNFCDD
jgi:hypothetical protein